MLKVAYHQKNIEREIGESVFSSVDVVKKNDDIELWKKFKEGSDIAFAEIYKNNVPLLYSYGFKLVTNKALIMDCIQDLFIEIWDTKERLGDVKSIKSYLYKSFRRKLISESIKQRKNLKWSDYSSESENDVVSFEHSLIEKQNFDLQSFKLKKHLESLTDKQREAIHLRFYARLSYLEISEIMSITKKGTYKLVARSITFLRKKMNSSI